MTAVSNYKSILLTGGAGFVGSAVARELLKRSDSQVTVIDNLFNGRQEFLPESPRVLLRRVDLRDAEEVQRVVRDAKPEVVIHLAAIHFIPYCNEHPTETFDVNVTATESLLQALRKSPPQRMAIASTAAVYPINDHPNREDSPQPAPTDVYGITKWVNERQLELFASQTGTLCGAARLSNVYGPRETNPHVLPEIVDQVLRGETAIALGNTKPKRDYIYVEDVAAGIVSVALKNEKPFRAYNVSTGAGYSVDELVAQLSEVSSRSLQIITDPNRVRKSDRPNLVCDPSRAETELGWKAGVGLTEGLKRLWDWSLSNCKEAVASN